MPAMFARTLFALVLAATWFGTACIQESRPVAQDTSAGDTDSPPDTTDADADADAESEVDAGVTCEGDDPCRPLATRPCEVGRCGEGGVCVVEIAPDETPCGDPGTCEGSTWTPPARCKDGTCTPGDAVVCAALPGTCEDVRCAPESGCQRWNKQQGDACVTGGGALLCEDGFWHPQDTCDSSGTCVDVPVQRCTAGFCQVPVCDATEGCGTKPLGVDAAIPGSWRFVLLRFVPGVTAASRDVLAARGTISLGADGKWSRDDVQASSITAFPLVGGTEYCASDNGVFQMVLGTEGGDPNQIFGQLTPARDLLVAVSHQRPELLVALEATNTSLPTESVPARYHMLGLVKKAVTNELYSIDGVLSFGGDGCLDRDATYQRSDQQAIVTIPSDGACLEFASDGAVRFPHTEQANGGAAVPIELSGYTLPGRDLILLSIDSATGVFPSLVLLVREGADAGPSALAGDYFFGGIESVEAGTNPINGKLSYDGEGGVIYYTAKFAGDELTGGGGPQDRYTVAVANPGDTGDLAGGYTHDVAVPNGRDRRLGHVAPRSAGSNLSPVVVHVPVTATWHIQPGLQVVIRRD